MAKGELLGMERIEFVCPQTGAEITQLTSNPTVSSNLYFEDCSFTPDSKTLVFISKRTAARNAPWDLFRVNADGSELVQLTECDGLYNAVLSLDGKRAFFTTQDEIRSVNMIDFHEEVIAHFEGASLVGPITVGGELIFAKVTGADGGNFIYRCGTDGAEGAVIHRGGAFNHLTACKTGEYLSWIRNDEINEYKTQTWHVMKADGTEDHRWGVGNWAHSSWIGKTDRMQGTLLPPEHAINCIGVHDTDPVRITSGPYFWHSSASHDGEWIVSDTNWPNIGIQLVHVPSGRYQTLCLDQSSNASQQPTHPHPVFSPDGTKVCFNSDKTGIPQVYVVKIPEYLVDELRTGKLLKRHRIGGRGL
jgi:hypothetical protein